MIPMYDLHVLGLPGSSESPPFLFGAVWAVARLGSVLDGAGGAGRRRLDVPWQDMIFVDVVRRRFSRAAARRSRCPEMSKRIPLRTTCARRQDLVAKALSKNFGCPPPARA